VKHPDNNESYIERVLTAVPGFAAARVGPRLSDGPTNTSYRVECAGEHYVLRLDKPGARQLGLNRDNERRVARAVADAGLAPEPLFHDTAGGVYLRRFLPGRCWDTADLAKPENLRRLAALLRKLHSLPPHGEGFDPLAAARRYAAQSGNEAARSVLQRTEAQMQKIGKVSPHLALCHNDLVCQNILESDQLMLIDWEYAAVGDPFFDLAVIVQHHRLDRNSAELFLRAYLQDSFGREALIRLDAQCDFYQCLLDLWNLRVAEAD